MSQSEVQVAPAVVGPHTLQAMLRLAVDQGASDLHVRAGGPPLLRISGRLHPIEHAPLTNDDAEALVLDALELPRDRETFLAHQECDFALQVDGIGRFRGNAYRMRGTASMVLRHVREQVPSVEALGLPPIVTEFASLQAGLVVVAGPTGSGKTTSLASLIDLVNRTRRCHILTIEDPIEFLHRDQLSTVSQREIHTDTEDFATALRSGMRQDPDVILVGEIRDLETLRTALQASETGHLVLASLHAKSAVDAVNRMIDMFPAGEQRQARAALAESLMGIVCQRLVASQRHAGRLPVVEILASNGRVRDAISDPDKTVMLSEIIAEGEFYGMRTLEQDLVRLVLGGDISLSDAEGVIGQVSDLHVALKRAGYTAGRVQ
jgi:twitching motility protein PilT